MSKDTKIYHKIDEDEKKDFFAGWPDDMKLIPEPKKNQNPWINPSSFLEQFIDVESILGIKDSNRGALINTNENTLANISLSSQFIDKEFTSSTKFKI